MPLHKIVSWAALSLFLPAPFGVNMPVGIGINVDEMMDMWEPAAEGAPKMGFAYRNGHWGSAGNGLVGAGAKKAVCNGYGKLADCASAPKRHPQRLSQE